ncbi:hypothetical protein SeMB42_g01788 [Synchytrium endobioticum]|uniref:Cytochrome b561 domain-containing protein n=1 Tax=Synchytrium endobioticum TaxID=286115 RepID=A0A507D861_9FUNG|nr:hypothetical protein SeLEV6574_g02512 [Synchytrium endobioticum]TPX51903.1 hypothetical protein SeMB42_g01788 [Synchytrium endobioticum]
MAAVGAAWIGAVSTKHFQVNVISHQAKVLSTSPGIMKIIPTIHAFVGLCIGISHAQLVINATPMTMTIVKTNMTHGAVTLTGPTNIWLSIGVGATMSNADCIVAWANADNTVTVSRRFSSGLVVPTPYPMQNVAVVSMNVTGATFSVTIARPLAAMGADEIELKAGNQAYIYAYGSDKPTTADPASTFTIHATTGRKEFMANFLDAPVNNGTGGAAAGGGAATATNLGPADGGKYVPLIMAHGFVLFLCWCVAAPAGVMLARNLKKELGVWWFKIHMGLGIFILVGGVGGAATAFYAHGLVSALPHASYASIGIHGPLGILMTLGTIFQVILGYVIDKLWSPTREGIPWWDKMHWYFGRVIIIAGIYETHEGIELFAKSSPIDAGWWVLFWGWLITIGLGFLFLQVISPVAHHTAATHDEFGDHEDTGKAERMDQDDF